MVAEGYDFAYFGRFNSDRMRDFQNEMYGRVVYNWKSVFFSVQNGPLLFDFFCAVFSAYIFESKKNMRGRID